MCRRILITASLPPSEKSAVCHGFAVGYKKAHRVRRESSFMRESPAEFVRQIGSSQESFAVWFCERIKKCNGMDLAEPLAGPPSQLVTDAQVN